MSKVEEMLLKLCPGGVTFKRVDEVCIRQSGLPLTAGEMRVLDIPGGDVRIFAGGQTVADVNSDSIGGKFIEGPGLIVKSRGIIDFEFWLGRYSHKNEFWSYRPKGAGIDLKFLYYFLKTKVIEVQLIARANSVKMPQIKVGDVDSMLVPVPPIEIQIEVVRILDTFTKLEAGLEAELEARKSQYEHYRSHLLSFRDAEPGEVRWIPLGDVCDYRKERSKLATGKFLYVGVEDLLQERRGVSGQAEFVSSSGHDIFMPGDVLLGNIRPYLKKVWRADVEGRTNGDVLVITPRQEAITELDTSYLYFILSSDDFFSYCVQTSRGAKMPRGDKRAILRYEIPVPSIEVQKRIAKNLALFEQLTQDLESGLPAEQAARRKQYEYYRNKLLKFNELDVA